MALVYHPKSEMRPRERFVELAVHQINDYCEIVKNFTVAIDEETYRRARVRAASEDTSVSSVVRKFLQDYARTEEERLNKARARMKLLFQKTKGFGVGRKPSREEKQGLS